MPGRPFKCVLTAYGTVSIKRNKVDVRHVHTQQGVGVLFPRLSASTSMLLACLLAELTNFVTATSTQQCKCKAGYGSPTGEGTCRVCPAGTFSPGGTMEDCKACPFGKTSKPGSSSAAGCVSATQACPVGQVPTQNAVSQHQCGCLPGYGGEPSSTESCAA